MPLFNRKKESEKSGAEEGDDLGERFKKGYEKQKRKRPHPKDRYRIIQLINKMIDKQIEDVRLKIRVPEEVYFRCNHCGKCCDNVKFRVSITVKDCAKWLRLGKKEYLYAIDRNRGHPKDTLFFITKANFLYSMAENYGEEMCENFVEINPSLEEIHDDEHNQCVFYNSLENRCSIYPHRPLYCQVYPYQILFDVKLHKLYKRGYRKTAKMRLKEKEYIRYVKHGAANQLYCPDEVTQKNEDNLRTVKQSKWAKRIKKLIISELFSGSLYFANRKDVFEDVLYALFAKE